VSPLRSRRRARARARSPRGEPEPSARVAVFAPSPLLTITIEPGTDRPEVHLHAGGQGVWAARLAATLGAEVTLAARWAASPGGSCEG